MTGRLKQVVTEPRGGVEAVVDLHWTAHHELPTHLVGPFCEHAKTLTTRTELVAGEVPHTQRALVLDPCYWSPESPHLYRCELADGSEGPTIGLRDFHAAGADLLLERRRHVLRGARVETDLLDDGDWNELRELGLTIVLDDPQVEACWHAAHLGIGVVVSLDATGSHPRDRINALAACPAVLCIMLGLEWAQAVAGEPLPAGPLYGMAIDDDLIPPPDWAGCMGLVLDERELSEIVPVRPDWPLLLFKYADGITSFADAAAAVQQLQKKSAPLTNLAGYLLV